MRIYRWLLVGTLLLAGHAAHAEGNCPQGYYPIGAPQGQAGPQSCAPIPGYNNNPEQPQPLRPPPQWESRWMAIATDAVKGSLGTSINMSNQNDAEHAAIARCQAKGGTQCKIDVSEGNGCAAMVVGDTGYNVQGAATLIEATELAMKTCTSATSNCHVYYSACSLPLQTQ